MQTDSDIAALYPESSRIIVSRDSDTIRSDDEDTIQPGGWSPLLVLAGATCCLGSALPAGFNIGVINTPSKLIKAFCNESLEQRYGVQISEGELHVLWSAIVSIFLIGGVSGSLTAGLLADKLGRKGALIIGNLCGIIGAILFLLTPILNSVEILLAGRLIVGLSGGLATSLLPMYMSELAPLSLRGAVGVLCQLGITTGVLAGQVLGLDTILGTEELWQYMLAAFSPLCVLALLFTFVLPESPKYLYVIKEQHERALTELSRLRNTDVILLRNEVLVLEQELSIRTTSDNWTISRVLNDQCLRLPLVLVILMQFGQQLSGINAVFYYSDSIFEKAGLDKKTSQYATIGTGVANVFVAIISVLLMSRIGRRSLILRSCYLSASCLLVLCFAIAFIHTSKYITWLCILAVQAYVIFYGLGLGPIPFFIGSELFDVGPRPTAMALGSVANWGGNFVVGMTFPALQNLIGSYTFLIFIVCILALSLFLRTYLPETRGRSTTELASIMTQGFKSRPNDVLSSYGE